jgi:hypothetical protein
MFKFGENDQLVLHVFSLPEAFEMSLYCICNILSQYVYNLAAYQIEYI